MFSRSELFYWQGAVLLTQRDNHFVYTCFQRGAGLVSMMILLANPAVSDVQLTNYVAMASLVGSLGSIIPPFLDYEN
jgi:hypothetical protein